MKKNDREVELTNRVVKYVTSIVDRINDPLLNTDNSQEMVVATDDVLDFLNLKNENIGRIFTLSRTTNLKNI